MKKLIIALTAALLLVYGAASIVRADCDTPDPGDGPTFFE